MSNFTSRRERLQQRQQNRQRRSWITWLVIGLPLLGLIYLLVSPILRGPYGEKFPIQSSEHIQSGTDPGEYSTDPPTSGHHYPEPLSPGFYEESDLADLGPFPHARAVHNLEHGYIIFWYNCDLLDETGCEQLKTQIRDYMAGPVVPKLIAYPWPGSDVALVLTSWGYMLEMPEFNAGQASRFINSNRLLAPEPDGP